MGSMTAASLSARRSCTPTPSRTAVSPRHQVRVYDGSLFVWKTGLTKKGKKRTKKGKKEKLEKSDDWKYKHGVYWPRKGDMPWYSGSHVGQKRIAFVFRCTRPRRWYQTAWPHRVVVPPSGECKKPN